MSMPVSICIHLNNDLIKKNYDRWNMEVQWSETTYANKIGIGLWSGTIYKKRSKFNLLQLWFEEGVYWRLLSAYLRTPSSFFFIIAVAALDAQYKNNPCWWDFIPIASQVFRTNRFAKIWSNADMRNGYVSKNH